MFLTNIRNFLTSISDNNLFINNNYKENTEHIFKNIIIHMKIYN